MVIGTLALVGTPFFSGFYSKDTIIEAAAAPRARSAQLGRHATATGRCCSARSSPRFYSFRLLYLTFHGKERFHDPVPDHYVAPEADSTEHEEALAHEHEAHDDDAHGTPRSRRPRAHAARIAVGGDRAADPAGDPVDPDRFLHRRPDAVRHRHAGSRQAAAVLPGCDRRAGAHDVIGKLAEEFHGPVAFALHGFKAPAFWLALRGLRAGDVHVPGRSPDLPAQVAQGASRWPVRVLENKYGIDDLWIDGFAGGGVGLGKALARDRHARDRRRLVNGSARVVDLVAAPDAPRAVRLPLPLCLRDDPRPDRCCWPCSSATGADHDKDLANVHVLAPAQPADLAADPRRRADPGVRQRPRAAPRAGSALAIGAADLRCSASRCSPASTTPTPACSSSKSTRGSRPTTSATSLGADGISVALIVLTTLTTLLVLIGAWTSIDKRVSQYFAAFLILEGLMVGVFCALDAMLFYVFFEAHADPDVHHHRRLGRPAARVRGDQVLPLHLPRLGVHAGRADLPVPEGRQLAARRPVRAAADARPSRCGCSSPSWPRSRSRCRCSRCTPGCRTRTSRRRPAVR